VNSIVPPIGVLSCEQEVTIGYALKQGARFHDHDRLAQSGNAGMRLYVATRDFRAAEHEVLGEEMWRFDTVHWSGADLSTGELKRSIGHWNPIDQEEDFLCRSGNVWMLFHAQEGQDVFLVGLHAGESVSAHPGWWHLTYVESADAVVENSYSFIRPRRAGKYQSDSTRLPRITLVRLEDGAVGAFNPRRTAMRLHIRQGDGRHGSLDSVIASRSGNRGRAANIDAGSSSWNVRLIEPASICRL